METQHRTQNHALICEQLNHRKAAQAPPMRVLLAVAALLVVAGAASVSVEDLEFDAWKQKFGEKSTSNLLLRKLILEHNMLADQGLKSYRLSMNRFADMDNQEYQQMFKGCLGSFNESEIESETTFLQQEEGAARPRNVDWRARGYVTRVKDQSHCGSCWAFSVTGALEGQMFRKTRMLVRLSEQQLVDCSGRYGNRGCHGGWPHWAFKYIMYSGGLETVYTYPYQAKEGYCRVKKQRAWAKCSGYRKVCHTERALRNAVATIGPISVAIDTSRHSFQFYKSGVHDEPNCSSTNVTHAVLIVGYGTEANKKDYWLVKNRNTIALTAVIAEVIIAVQEQDIGPLPEFRENETLNNFAQRCKAFLDGKEELREKIKELKKGQSSSQ
ncbi:digestive cysteine proteinase 3-like [Colossoma macropomum]|uniref:digestive cysteine proteinase 3-like n=1 Tax=Colossoma macropomum TaxID=42526 RepID=UPI0018640B47|nr:digestive cysteine proteinase 3-like [Colossoma macropomum]